MKQLCHIGLAACTSRAFTHVQCQHRDSTRTVLSRIIYAELRRRIGRPDSSVSQNRYQNPSIKKHCSAVLKTMIQLKLADLAAKA